MANSVRYSQSQINPPEPSQYKFQSRPSCSAYLKCSLDCARVRWLDILKWKIELLWIFGCHEIHDSMTSLQNLCKCRGQTRPELCLRRPSMSYFGKKITVPYFMRYTIIGYNFLPQHFQEPTKEEQMQTLQNKVSDHLLFKTFKGLWTDKIFCSIFFAKWVREWKESSWRNSSFPTRTGFWHSWFCLKVS